MLSAKEVREFDVEKDFIDRYKSTINTEMRCIEGKILEQRKNNETKLTQKIEDRKERRTYIYNKLLTSNSTYILAWKYAKPIYEEKGYTVEIHKRKVIISWGDNEIKETTYTLKSRKKLFFDGLSIIIGVHLILIGIFGFIWSILKACNVL